MNNSYKLHLAKIVTNSECAFTPNVIEEYLNYTQVCDRLPL